MSRTSRRVAATLLLVLACIAVPLPAAADTEGAIVVSVEISPLATCTGVCVPSLGDLARAGLDASPALLAALALVLLGVAGVAVSRARRRAAHALGAGSGHLTSNQ